MVFQYSPYIIPLLIAALVSAWVVVYCWPRRHSPTAFALMLLGIAMTAWSVGYALEIAGTNLETKLFWGKMQYLAIPLVPVIWLVLGLSYANLTQWLARRSIPLLLFLPLLTIALALTNDSHNLIWTKTFFSQTGSFSSLGVEYGIWFWIHSAFSYVLLLTGTVILVRSIARIKLPYKRQVLALLIGVLVPWIGNAIYIFGLSPIPRLDLTPFFFTVSLASFTLSIYGFRLIDLSPIAQDIVIEEMKDGMIVLDIQNRVVDINPSAVKLLSTTESQVIGKTIPRVITNLPHLIARYMETPEALDEITIGNGDAQRWYELRISSLNDRRNRFIGRVLTIHDITSRKKTEILLQESEARYRQIVENASDVIYRTDAQGNFTYVNHIALRLMGFKDEKEVLGRHFLEFASPAARHQLKRFYDKQFLSGEENSYNEFPAITADGREIWFGQNVQIINDGGVVTGFQAVARNITERKQSESAMAFARDQAIEANRLKSQLLAKVSHELRIPLSAILGFAELLRDNVYGQLSGRQKSAITEIIDSTDYLAKLIEDLLFEAQVEAKVVKLNKEPIALDDFIRGIERNMSVLARNKKLGISFTCSGDPPATITGDRQRLQQVMVNLIGNAIKFTKTGDVRVRVFCPDPDHWSFDVSDTGIGIPDEVQNKIFEPFRQVEGAVTEENRGTGLGLAITQQLVELMGGDIKVSSKVKVGSTFTVTLPNR